MKDSTDLVEDESSKARALSAPTRVRILDLLRMRGSLSVREVADAVGIHGNVARGHLDMLVSAGLANASWKRNPNGGRPAKVYDAVPVHQEQGPAMVSDMLATLIEVASPAPETARAVAISAGEKLVKRLNPDAPEHLEFQEQIHVLTRALSAVSGGVQIVDQGPNWIEIVDRDCPFGAIAKSHPEVACSLDRALKEGMVEGVGAKAFVEVLTSVAWGDPECREVIRWQEMPS